MKDIKNANDYPILDGFYDSPCFLTPEKAFKNKYDFAKEYCKNNKITTLLLPFNRNLLKNIEDILPGAIEIAKVQAGEDFHPLYAYKNVLITVPFVGSPNAGCILEEISILGIKNVIATGSAGLLDENFDVSKFLVVDRAIRDEGSSYHYEKPSLYTYPSKTLTDVIENTFNKLGVQYEKGTTWTFDSFYRESKDRIALRKSQGATSVEMECATWCVVAKKLGMNFAQFLYFSDKVANNDWSKTFSDKNKKDEIRNQITMLCLEIAKNI